MCICLPHMSVSCSGVSQSLTHSQGLQRSNLSPSCQLTCCSHLVAPAGRTTDIDYVHIILRSPNKIRKGQAKGFRSCVSSRATLKYLGTQGDRLSDFLGTQPSLLRWALSPKRHSSSFSLPTSSRSLRSFFRHVLMAPQPPSLAPPPAAAAVSVSLGYGTSDGSGSGRECMHAGRLAAVRACVRKAPADGEVW